MTNLAETQLRVLIIAEAANPEWVSVPLVGWSLARALRNVADVHIVTQIRNREAFLRAGLIEGQDFTAIDSEAMARPLWALGEKLKMGEGKGWTMLQAVSALSYPHFERLVWRKFGKGIQAGRFDLVHRVTPLSPTVSSPLAPKCRRAGVPFVLGPLNGGVPWPRQFDRERRREREWLSYVRSIYKLIPGRRKSLAATSAIIAGSRHTQSEIPRDLQDRSIFIPENAVDPARFSKVAQPDSDLLRACFVGRMVPYKGPDMLLQAAAPLLRGGKMHLHMIGDGPMLPQLKSLVQREGISDAITFHGWMAHEDVQSVMTRCAVMPFPSIREFGGGVVLEAMALGVVPLIVDYAGPGELVDSRVGYKVALGGREEIIKGFRDRLEKIAADRTDLESLALAGRTLVAEKFTWDCKARQVLQVYEWVLGRRPVKPVFFD